MNQAYSLLLVTDDQVHSYSTKVSRHNAEISVTSKNCNAKISVANFSTPNELA